MLPPGCQVQRNEDGSWSAWDQSHVIDVSIIETSGRADGSAMTAENMVGGAQGERHDIGGVIVALSTDVEETDTPSGRQPIDWTRVTAGATNTALVMSIGNGGGRDDAWHRSIWENIAHTERRSRLGKLFSRG
jgi:hypothetical protein